MKILYSRGTEELSAHSGKFQIFLPNLLEDISNEFNNTRYDSELSFISFLNDADYINEIKDRTNKFKTGLKKVFIIGIGGANLATKAIYEALKSKTTVEAIFLDSTNSLTASELKARVDLVEEKEEFVVCVISKSGKTIETISNAELVFSYLESKFEDIADRVLIVTEKGSELAKTFKNSDLLFFLPNKISDRFSAFSQNALVPLSILGFDIDSYIEGGRKITEETIKLKDKSSSFLTASVLSYWAGKGKDIFDMFFFLSRLETLGKWHRQLFAESVGKEFTLTGEKAEATYTPIVSIGTTDLHSSLQLNLAQPDKRLTQFVHVDDFDEKALKDSKTLGDLDKRLVGKTQNEITKVILNSVKASYDIHDMPYFEITLDSLTEREIAEYMATALLQTVVLGDMWNVNVFNQPNVEDYKERARASLN